MFQEMQYIRISKENPRMFKYWLGPVYDLCTLKTRDGSTHIALKQIPEIFHFYFYLQGLYVNYILHTYLNFLKFTYNEHVSKCASKF